MRNRRLGPIDSANPPSGLKTLAFSSIIQRHHLIHEVRDILLLLAPAALGNQQALENEHATSQLFCCMQLCSRHAKKRRLKAATISECSPWNASTVMSPAGYDAMGVEIATNLAPLQTCLRCTKSLLSQQESFLAKAVLEEDTDIIGLDSRNCAKSSCGTWELGSQRDPRQGQDQVCNSCFIQS